MTDVAGLIADLVAAGTPAALIGRVAAALAAPSRDEELSADRRERDRIRKRILRDKSKVASEDIPRTNAHMSADTPSSPPLPDKEIPQTPLENNPSLTPSSVDLFDAGARAGERVEAKPKRRTRLTSEWVLPKAFGEWALEQGMSRDRIMIEAENMRDWSINAGSIGAKLDWMAAWRGWVRRAMDGGGGARASPVTGRRMSQAEITGQNLRQRIGELQQRSGNSSESGGHLRLVGALSSTDRKAD